MATITRTVLTVNREALVHRLAELEPTAAGSAVEILVTVYENPLAKHDQTVAPIRVELDTRNPGTQNRWVPSDVLTGRVETTVTR